MSHTPSSDIRPVYESIIEQPNRRQLSSDCLLVSETTPEQPKSEDALDRDPRVQAGREATPVLSRRNYDIRLLVLIIIMLVWPIIFSVVVFAQKGVQLSNSLAKVVKDHPQGTNYFFTLFSNIINMVVGSLFSFAVIRFSQEWIAKTDATVYHVSVITGFRYRFWPWGLQDLRGVFAHNKWLPVVMLLCLSAFANVPSSATSLLTPIPYNRTIGLKGTEIDFSTSDANCLRWLSERYISNVCDWHNYKGMNYTSCLGENQMVDVLESGRGNILSLLSNNSESHTLSQLGARDGLRILGPIRGVLPIGPNGVPAFDTLENSPFSDQKTRDGMLSYDYTLEQQGLTSNISCLYDAESPVAFSTLPDGTAYAVQYNGTCDGKADVLTDVQQIITPASYNGLGFWACGSPSNGTQDPSYFIYLYGRQNYAEAIGNITCTISPIKPATFPVTYHSQTRIFSVKGSTSVSSATYPRLIERTLVALGGIIGESQNSQSNLVAESVITFGVKSFGLPPYVQNQRYLRLYESMIQGMLEYEASYSRLIYSTAADMPDSCRRAVTGSVTYQVIGWYTASGHFGYLAPMTLINLVSLFIIIMTMHKATGRASADDPTDLERLLAATRSPAEGNDVRDKVVYQPKQKRVETSEKFNEKSEPAGYVMSRTDRAWSAVELYGDVPHLSHDPTHTTTRASRLDS